MSSPSGSGAPDRKADPSSDSPALIGSGWAPSHTSSVPLASTPAASTPAASTPASTPVRAATRGPEREPEEPAFEPVDGAAGDIAAPHTASAGTASTDTASTDTASSETEDGAPTTVLPGASASAPVRRPPPPRPTARPSAGRPPSRAGDTSTSRPTGKSRRARLALQRIDPWSVFLYALVSSIFLGIALVVAVFVLYSVLGNLGVPDTINELYAELTDAADPILTSSRVLTTATVLATVNVVLLTLLATLGSLLYNLCATFTGGIEVTLGERDS